MSYPEMIRTVEAAGVSIRADGENLIAAPREKITPELREFIRANKGMLLKAVELDRLIDLVATHHAFTEAERAEAREIALGNVENALVCFSAVCPVSRNQELEPSALPCVTNDNKILLQLH